MKMNKQSKEIKKKAKKVKKLKKEVKKTLDWIDVEEIELNYIELKSNKKVEHVVGIKIVPPNILLSDNQVKKIWVERLRETLNKVELCLYHSFVYSPINLDEHLAPLYARLNVEENPVLRSMITNRIEQWNDFSKEYFELEFFILTKGTPCDSFTKNFRKLIREYSSAGFNVKTLNVIDFENLIAFDFNNDLISDFYFSRGEFEFLHEDYKEIQEYNFENEANHEFSIQHDELTRIISKNGGNNHG